MAQRSILWFRQDLRLHDNPALQAAISVGDVIPVYILDDVSAGKWAMGGASRWWLHHSLASLAASLAALGSRLILLRGDARELIPQITESYRANAVFWNRCYEPFAIARDTAIKQQLTARGIAVQSFKAGLWAEPWELKPASSAFYQVFTPFWKALQKQHFQWDVMPAPEQLAAVPTEILSDTLESWQLLPTQPDWAGGLRQCWQPSEADAQQRLTRFLAKNIVRYKTHRDIPASSGTSSLAAHLHFGEISPKQVANAVVNHCQARDVPLENANVQMFFSELGWREFAHHLLYHFPELPEKPFKAKFAAMAWQEDEDLLAAWQQGRTGVPMVDAGMRELWHTGTMHNRVRMIAASFLTKHLLQPWQAGQAWFWDTLVDADLAANSFNWQWVAGCGADAAPFFRIFNPVLQGEKFDAEGNYIRRWIPELASLSTKFIHQPWCAPVSALHQAGVTLGRDYPLPIVDLQQGREAALARYGALQNSTLPTQG